MCGRFLLDSEIRELIINYKTENGEAKEYIGGDFYPTSMTPVIFNEGIRKIGLAKWGFSFSSDKKPVINARAETIMQRSMFKNSFYSRRCIIPANLFYEWSSLDSGKKVKHKICRADESILSLGGIYSVSQDDRLDKRLSFVIITREAIGQMRQIHNRMPLIIEKDSIDTWLNNGSSIKDMEALIHSHKSIQLKIEKCNESPKTSFEQLSIFRG